MPAGELAALESKGGNELSLDFAVWVVWEGNEFYHSGSKGRRGRASGDGRRPGTQSSPSGHRCAMPLSTVKDSMIMRVLKEVKPRSARRPGAVVPVLEGVGVAKGEMVADDLFW